MSSNSSVGGEIPCRTWRPLPLDSTSLGTLSLSKGLSKCVLCMRTATFGIHHSSFLIHSLSALPGQALFRTPETRSFFARFALSAVQLQCLGLLLPPTGSGPAAAPRAATTLGQALPRIDHDVSGQLLSILRQLTLRHLTRESGVQARHLPDLVESRGRRARRPSAHRCDTACGRAGR